MKNELIKIENLSFKYKKSRDEVFLNISCDFNIGDRVSIIVKNGSGKSTLLYLIMGVLKKTKGLLKGQLLESNLKIGCVLQQMNYEYNLPLMQIAKFYSQSSNMENILSILSKYDLIKYQRIPYGRLSLGLMQRFKLAMSLINEPDILIFDEISTSLDYEYRRIILNDIKEYLDKFKDKTLFLVSHYPYEIIKLTNQIVYIENKSLKIFKYDDKDIMKKEVIKIMGEDF